MQTLIYTADDNSAIGKINGLPVHPAYNNAAFSQTFSTSNALTAIEFKGGTSGKSIYVTDLVISAKQANDLTILDSESNVVMQPLHMAANSVAPLHFGIPIKITAGDGTMVRASAQGEFSITMNGYVI